MPINYSYLNGRPNATYRDEIINNPGLLTQRQQSEAYRLARQANPNFGYPGTTSSQQQPTEASRPLGEAFQMPGLGAAFGPDWGGVGREGQQQQQGNTQSGRLQSLFGYDPNMATVAAGVGNLAGLPFSGLAANLAFGDDRSIKNAGINAGIGFGLSQLGKAGPVIGSLIDPAMKAYKGQALDYKDVLKTLGSLHPTTRTAMALWSTGSALANMFKKNQSDAEEEMNTYVDQAQFDSMPSVENSPYPSQQQFGESVPMPTTENTFDMMDSPFASFNDFGGGYGADGGGWDGGSDPGKVGFQ